MMDEKTKELYDIEQSLGFSNEQLEFLNVLKDHYFNLGYDVGYQEGKAQWFQHGYQAGLEHGKADGIQEGYDSGWDNGYLMGVRDAGYNP